MEEMYWSSLKGESPLYGADVMGTLFKDLKNPWNINYLDSLLKEGLNKKNLKGITTPYLYIGGFRTTFAWHVEDYNLASINYMHYGAPKVWYTIARKDYKKFQQFVKNIFPREFLECSEYLRHKTIVINPYFIREYMPNITITKLV